MLKCLLQTFDIYSLHFGLYEAIVTFKRVVAFNIRGKFSICTKVVIAVLH